jgi:hypothetical protein
MLSTRAAVRISRCEALRLAVAAAVVAAVLMVPPAAWAQGTPFSAASRLTAAIVHHQALSRTELLDLLTSEAPIDPDLLIRGLASEDPNTREVAAVQLGETPPKETSQAVLDALDAMRRRATRRRPSGRLGVRSVREQRTVHRLRLAARNSRSACHAPDGTGPLEPHSISTISVEQQERPARQTTVRADLGQ